MPSDRQPQTFPTFETVEDERRHRKQRLAAGVPALRAVRLRRGRRRPHHRPGPRARPTTSGSTRSGMSFKQIRVQDLLLVNDHGEVVEGNWPVNQAAFAIHSADPRRPPRRRRRRPHPLGLRQGVLVAAPAPRSPSPRTPAPSTTTTPSSTTSPAWCSTPRRASASPTPSASGKAAILVNHGLLTVGHSVDEAVWWFITMERSCQAQLLAMAAGTPVPIERRDRPAHRRPGGLARWPGGSRPSRSSTGSSGCSPTASRTDPRAAGPRPG